MTRETEVRQQEMAYFDDAIGCVVRLVEICHQEEGEKCKMPLALKWVRLRSVEVVGVAQGRRMFYTTVLTLHDAQERNVSVKTIFCYPGNIQCQTNADQTNQ